MSVPGVTEIKKLWLVEEKTDAHVALSLCKLQVTEGTFFSGHNSNIVK